MCQIEGLCPQSVLRDPEIGAVVGLQGLEFPSQPAYVSIMAKGWEEDREVALWVLLGNDSCV